ncbi:rRNA maturation RNase YbeY [Jeotgalibacillus sp. ET6]|uniref:rRNA maturation RNase YbeY n=1 Tax=Jeotgalibacillus sp. ET6 TaxID=3037260 RepID=UPI002418170D|nr:rRNA maturation RNase YbeY [Jeotgalibacillus sp. ET6]MDG5470849.1 rRNA maturation RNase YbeY [Jeotgalibacillus sp. ET6]
MTLNIDFFDETDSLEERDTALVEDLLLFASKKEGVQNGECSVTFVTNDKIQEINKTYRGKDKPTDVISFAMEDEAEGDLAVIGADIPRMLGDIVISVQVAKEQADEYGHSFSRELGFLALHGFLHLLGYDHIKESDEAVMFGRQNVILEEFGLARS